MADNGTGQTGPRVNIHEPLSPPFYQASPANQGPYALLTAVILIIITGLTLMIKFRTVAATFRRPRRDDIALAAALSYYVSNILLYLSLASAKASATMLIIAIKPSRRMLVSFYSVLAIVGIWAIAAVLAVALQCKPTRWVMGPSTSDTCIDQYGAQVGIRLVDIATDAALALLPAVMVSSIQMSFHKRLVVAFMFGLRLVQVTPVLTAISLVKLGNFYNATLEDRPFEAVVPSIWTSLALNVSIITACLPSIKRFLTDWAVGVANAGIAETYELQNSSRSYGNGQPPTVRSYTSPHSRRRSEDRSQAVYDGGATHEYRARRRRDDHSRVDNDAESERGLTDGILQTIDYRVEFEETQHRRECSEGSKR
ncbi:hypothetical protein LTR01_006739 [Friedmanniomyces endolithicus]|nr:hypothetical protein LTR01_006739 [Friedmanniomyces endolithicus]KAK0824312.1 hypothetical protein LTR73_007790 [Friedmanniomyces endolithicus]